jgi:hypothetical protein
MRRAFLIDPVSTVRFAIEIEHTPAFRDGTREHEG